MARRLHNFGVPGHLINAPASLILGLGRSSGSTAGAVNGELNNPGLLEDILLVSDQLGTVDDIKVSNQSLFASNKGCSIKMFHPAAMVEGHRGIGLPIHKQVNIAVTATLAASGVLAASVGVQPLPPELLDGTPLPDVNELGEDLTTYFGLGATTCGAGALTTITATALRSCRLGALFLDASAAAGDYDIEVRDVRIQRRSLMAGDTAKGAPLAAFGPDSVDIDGRILAQDVEPNDVIDIDVWNYNGSSITVRGGIFLLPR